MAWAEQLRQPWVRIAAVAGLIAVAMLGWRLIPGGASPPPLSLVDLLQTLARDANTSLNDPTSVVRAPFFGVEPIGTLMTLKGRAVSHRCHPASAPSALVPTGFPPQRYHLQRSAAAKWTSDFLGGADAAVDLGSTRSIELGFNDVKANLMVADEVAEMFGQPDCAAAASGRKLLVVVGYIEARRNFRLDGGMIDKARAAQGKTSFEVDAGSNNGRIEATDASPLPLFEIVSEVPDAAGAQPTKPIVDKAFTVGATQMQGGGLSLPATVPAEAANGRIFVQRDATDTSGNDRRFVEQLATRGFAVVRTVEKVPTERMPRSASVRYFNVSDIARAQRIAALLQPTYTNVTVQRMKFAAPLGQIEVWLPKVVGEQGSSQSSSGGANASNSQ